MSRLMDVINGGLVPIAEILSTPAYSLPAAIVAILLFVILVFSIFSDRNSKYYPPGMFLAVAIR
jgi:hypothetical protein